MPRIPNVRIEIPTGPVEKYSLMGSVWKIIKAAGHDDWAEEFKRRAHSSKSHTELLEICRDYFEVTEFEPDEPPPKKWERREFPEVVEQWPIFLGENKILRVGAEIGDGMRAYLD